MKITTKLDAELLGLTRYFTGIPCEHGHVCERKIFNSACVECCRRNDREYRRRMGPVLLTRLRAKRAAQRASA